MKPLKPKEFNPLCRCCRRKCKQPIYVQLISCPNFDKQAEQLEIDLSTKRSRTSKKHS